MKKITIYGKSATHVNIIDINEQKLNEALLESSLEEKEVLLKEIHHRVKNNLQVISSLIVLQEQNIDDKKILNIFRDFQSRIKSIALIHHILYDSENFNKLDISNYIKTLVENLFKIYSSDPNKIKLEYNIDDIELNLDRAISCGLIITELVANSLKYAFSEKEKGKIVIRLRKDEKQQSILEVIDNGKGLLKDVDFNNSETLGLKLVSTMTKQMGAKILIKRNKGTNISIIW